MSVFLSREHVLPRNTRNGEGFEKTKVVEGGCHHHSAKLVRERNVRVDWEGSDPICGDVPSFLGVALANPYLGYGDIPTAADVGKGKDDDDDVGQKGMEAEMARIMGF
jgi:hypothetical protein